MKQPPKFNYRHCPKNGILIASLREWRNADHEDNLVLNRNDVICLLAEIDAIPR